MRLGYNPNHMTIVALLLIGQTFTPSEYIIIRKGDCPIILSAPHGGQKMVPGVPERRGGPNIEKFVTTLDGYTKSTTLAIEEEIVNKLGRHPYVVIADFSRKMADVNRDEANGTESPEGLAIHRAYHLALHQAADEIKKQWRSGLVLDIHAQGSMRDSLMRGTKQLKSVTELLKKHGVEGLTGPNSFLGGLAQLGWKISPANNAKEQAETKFDGGFITDSMGSHNPNGIDAIQCELGIEFRNAEGKPKFAEDVALALERFIRAYEPGWLNKPTSSSTSAQAWQPMLCVASR